MTLHLVSSQPQPPEAVAGERRSHILPFPARPAVAERESDRIAELLLAMEKAPLTEPVLRAVRGVDRVVRLRVAVGDFVTLLSSDEVRTAARAVLAEQALPGCGLVAARLRDAADACDMASPLRHTQPDPARRHEGFTGLGFLIGLAGLALMVAAVVLAGKGG